MKLYKIRNKDGLYSTGGRIPKWTKRGKTWSTLAHIKLHLAIAKNYYLNKGDCKIVEIEVVESELKEIDITKL